VRKKESYVRKKLTPREEESPSGKGQRTTRLPAAFERKAEGIHLVRDPSGSAVAGLYESLASKVISTSDRVEDPPEPIPESRWLMFGDIALADARDEQLRIKEKIRPHVERYKRLTGNKV
jgi:hypothetical protein